MAPAPTARGFGKLKKEGGRKMKNLVVSLFLGLGLIVLAGCKPDVGDVGEVHVDEANITGDITVVGNGNTGEEVLGEPVDELVDGYDVADRGVIRLYPEVFDRLADSMRMAQAGYICYSAEVILPEVIHRRASQVPTAVYIAVEEELAGYEYIAGPALYHAGRRAGEIPNVICRSEYETGGKMKVILAPLSSEANPGPISLDKFDLELVTFRGEGGCLVKNGSEILFRPHLAEIDSAGADCAPVTLLSPQTGGVVGDVPPAVPTPAPSEEPETRPGPSDSTPAPGTDPGPYDEWGRCRKGEEVGGQCEFG